MNVVKSPILLYLGINNRKEIVSSEMGTAQLIKLLANPISGDFFKVIKKVLCEISLPVAVYTNNKIKNAEIISAVLETVVDFMSKSCYSQSSLM
jgi:hypothetical protein